MQNLSSSHLTVQETAERIGCHPLTVRRWISKGILPAERLGPRCVRIKITDVDALITPIRVEASS